MLDKNNHSVFSLNYHLVLVVKYRRAVFDDTISERAKDIFNHISSFHKIDLLEWNHDIDHIHVLFKAQPDTNLSKFIGSFKSASSRILKKDFPQITEKLWKEYFWSTGYCLITAGVSDIETITNYINNQGK